MEDAEKQRVRDHLAKKLVSRRRNLDMSQGLLGLGVGLTEGQIRNYENGEAEFRITRLCDFAKTLDVPIEYFVEGLIEQNTGQGLLSAAADIDALPDEIRTPLMQAVRAINRQIPRTSNDNER